MHANDRKREDSIPAREMHASFFDLKSSIESGQPLAFHCDYRENGKLSNLSYATAKGLMEMECSRTEKATLIRYRHFGEYTDSSAREEIKRRFGLGDDMNKVYSRINTDRFMDDAIMRLKGMRVTENDPWETMLSFIVSQFNNIKRIRGIVKSMKERYGESADYGGREVKLFPTYERISKASVEELMKCGAGFRAKYIKCAAEACAEGFNLEELRRMEYSDAREELMKLSGIGGKVADCILLFGYRRLEAFPVDVWIKRVVEITYMNGRKSKDREIIEFASGKWGDMAGYAQQYIYWYGRMNKIG
jgi:N-glycosylase/DNA lyase